MAGDDFEGDALEPEEPDPDEIETTDGAWEQERHATKAGRRWLLLLVIPVVALVVLQLQPGGSATSSATPTPTTSRVPSLNPLVAGPPLVSQLRVPLVSMTRPWDLFVRTDHSVVRIELGRGRVTRTPVPRLRSGGPVAFVPTRTGVLIRPRGHGPGYAVPDNEPAQRLTGALAKGGQVVAGPDLEHVWMHTTDVTGHGAMALVRTDGRRAGRLIAMPEGKVAWIRPDGGGYPLIATRHHVYDAHPRHLQTIPYEDVVAAGPTGWLVAACDEQERCGRIFVHRVTGDQHAVPGLVGRDYDMRGVVAPGGSHALMVGDVHHSPRARLLDLRTGAARTLRVRPDLGAATPASTIAWSPDGRWVVLVDVGGQVVVVNARSRQVHHLGLHLTAVRQVAVRAALSSP